jgi:hypothetical protein
MKSAKRIKNGICGGKLKTALVYNKVNLGKHEL